MRGAWRDDGMPCETDTGSGGNVNGHSMTIRVRNIHSKNF